MPTTEYLSRKIHIFTGFSTFLDSFEVSSFHDDNCQFFGRFPVSQRQKKHLPSLSNIVGFKTNASRSNQRSSITQFFNSLNKADKTDVICFLFLEAGNHHKILRIIYISKRPLFLQFSRLNTP